MKISLVSLETAREHLGIAAEDTSRNGEIGSKIWHASAIVLNYIKCEAVPADWLLGSPANIVNAPYNVQAATLLVMGELFMNRESSSANVLSETVIDLLSPYRTPTLA